MMKSFRTETANEITRGTGSYSYKRYIIYGVSRLWIKKESLCISGSLKVLHRSKRTCKIEHIRTLI